MKVGNTDRKYDRNLFDIFDDVFNVEVLILSRMENSWVGLGAHKFS